ncbi:YueI family protein [Lacticaseibacillus sharpeae]|uniref:DUF1694 domain-containing protein n=1 Tax=Lacticaseibacillus sharpeae JCM 1186 = DSM 20505 TaxID=1291052 RepID=A0A0R1ZJZ3_9LACO|nr:YueI family protein [Lacticaseibacillus sharpeae]KRM54773.1 hypothetical protein FC18_GL002188 [Lacticaseibacillus sharpeae JCM 1186 = DSM 20505]
MSEKNTDQLDDHLTTAIFGPRKTNPDERRKYLGSLRERVALYIDNQSLRNPHTVTSFKAVIKDYQHRDLSVLINGKLGTGTTSPFVKLCAQNDLPFTLISDDSAHVEDDAAGLLIVAKQAINQENISLPVQKQAEPKKRGFFGLF